MDFTDLQRWVNSGIGGLIVVVTFFVRREIRKFDEKVQQIDTHLVATDRRVDFMEANHVSYDTLNLRLDEKFEALCEDIKRLESAQNNLLQIYIEDIRRVAARDRDAVRGP